MSKANPELHISVRWFPELTDEEAEALREFTQRNKPNDMMFGWLEYRRHNDMQTAYVALSLVRHARVQALGQNGVLIVKVFISPFSRAELDTCEDQREVLPMIRAGRDVERTLAERSAMQFGKVGLTNVYAAHHRATTLVDELEAAAQFDHVLVLHNGHRPETWASDPPAGEAGEALSKLIAIVEQE